MHVLHTDVHSGAGPPSALHINPSIPRPTPKSHEVLVRIHAFGLNRADTLQRIGIYPIPPGASTILGLEFSGVIEEVGPEANKADNKHRWQQGDEVFGLAYGGCYAEYVAVSARMLLRKPASLSFEDAAGVPEVYFTALQALHLVGRYSPDTHRSILWHAGASGVSQAGIQLSVAANKHTGDAAHADLPPPVVLATARKDEKCRIAERLGASYTVNTATHPAEWPGMIKEHTSGKKGVDLTIDFVGAPFFQGNLDVAAMDGRVVQLGTMGGTALPTSHNAEGNKGGVDIGAFLRKRVRFEGSTLRSRDEKYQGGLRDLFEEKVMEGLVKGEFKAGVETVVGWEKVGEMHERMEANANAGKIVCLVK